MMKILMFSDIHFVNSKSWLSLCSDTCNWVAVQIKKAEPDLVVFLGDCHDNPMVTDIPTIVSLRLGFGEIAEAADFVGAKLVVMDGNHDKYNFTGDQSITEVLKGIPGLSVVHQFYQTGNIAFVAYQRDRATFASYVSAAIRGDAEYLFIHQGVNGLRFNKVTTDGAETRLMESFTRVFAGHYHMPQVLENIVVIGAPMYTSYRDQVIDIPRGLLIYDVGEDDWEWVENPTTPLYYTFRSEEDETIKEFRRRVRDVISTRACVRLIVPTDWVHPLSERYKDKVRELRVNPASVEADGDEAPPTVDTTAAPKAVFGEWLLTQPRDTRATLKKLGHQVLDEVSQTPS